MNEADLVLPAEKLAFYDEAVHKFVTPADTYDLMIGASSEDIRQKSSVTVK